MRIMLKDVYTPFTLNLFGHSIIGELLTLEGIEEEEFWEHLESVYVGRIGNA